MSYKNQAINSPSGQNQNINTTHSNTSSEALHISQNVYQIPTQIPTQFFIYCPKTISLQTMDPRTIQFDPKTGLAIAPEGYTAVYAPSPSISSISSFSTVSAAQTSSSTEAVSNSQPVNMTRSRAATPEPVKTVSKPKRKFPHRSKQIRIKEVHDDVASHFNAMGLYAFSETEVLRGEDTCRVHVKTYQGLNKILDVLKEVHGHPQVTLKRIATPISMKNRYQQKGFIVYMKLASTKQVPVVQGIFEKYKDFYKKCDVAKPKTDKTFAIPLPNKRLTTNTTTTTKSDNKIITCNISSRMMPQAMAKQASVGA